MSARVAEVSLSVNLLIGNRALIDIEHELAVIKRRADEINSRLGVNNPHRLDRLSVILAQFRHGTACFGVIFAAHGVLVGFSVANSGADI
jgi:hypothetical protein